MLIVESVITSTVLYGLCARKINNKRNAKLLSAQSKIVRQMLGLHWWKVAVPNDDEDKIEEATNSETGNAEKSMGWKETAESIESAEDENSKNKSSSDESSDTGSSDDKHAKAIKEGITKRQEERDRKIE